MEVSDTFQITLKIVGKAITLPRVRRDEELFYRNAEKTINERYTYYVNNYPKQSEFTYLLMAIIDIAVRFEKSKEAGNLSPIMPRLTKLVEELQAAL